MTHEDRATLIARYRAGYDEVVAALEGITAVALDWRPAATEWSAREVIHHLADSEMIAGIRLRRILVEDEAQLWPYAPGRLAERLAYADRPLDAALALFRWTRACTAELLDRMTEADWAKAGMPTPNGEYSTVRWLRGYSGHAHEHADQIRANRAACRA